MAVTVHEFEQTINAVCVWHNWQTIAETSWPCCTPFISVAWP